MLTGTHPDLLEQMREIEEEEKAELERLGTTNSTPYPPRLVLSQPR